mgnify:CR=1 FL=1
MEVLYIMAQKVQFVETVLRDANQSLIATRLPFEKFEFIHMGEDYVGTYEEMDEMPVGIPYERIHCAVGEDLYFVVKVP